MILRTSSTIRRASLSGSALRQVDASPAILLHSGIGPAADLRALGIEPLVDLPGVGGNLIDHPHAAIILQPRADAALPAGNLVLWTTAPGSDERGDLHLIMGRPPIPGAQIGMRANLMRPRSRGRLSLSSADPHLPPRIELNFLAEEEDLRRLLAGVRLAAELARSPRLAPFVEGILAPSEEELASDTALADYVRANVGSYHHPVGTARMGSDVTAGAVVDQYCKVHGVDNLRVVDASVMPNIPRANTNLTCIMIGEHVADWLKT